MSEDLSWIPKFSYDGPIKYDNAKDLIYKLEFAILTEIISYSNAFPSRRNDFVRFRKVKDSEAVVILEKEGLDFDIEPFLTKIGIETAPVIEDKNQINVKIPYF